RPRSARSWRRKTENFHPPGEPWRALATSSLSDEKPRLAEQARKWVSATKMA
ncbi:hypothetical protein A2U01_0114269, partial [Trifolium medium]|nr:hypothetical protein [Trifolium medium]